MDSFPPETTEISPKDAEKSDRVDSGCSNPIRSTEYFFFSQF